MDIYVLDNARSKDFIALCETIKINPNKTCDDFIHNGFTNYYEPVLHFCRKINYLVIKFVFLLTYYLI